MCKENLDFSVRRPSSIINAKKMVAITGGIGAGKSYVATLLSLRGIEVYDCDAAAKKMMREDVELKRQLCSLVGDELYIGGELRKPILAKYILSSQEHKNSVNNIVHPAVASDFLLSGKSWLESAILFESGFDRRLSFDAIVCVAAPESVRLERIMRRDCLTEEKAMQWIRMQMPMEEMIAKSDYVIENDGLKDINRQMEIILQQIEIVNK